MANTSVESQLTIRTSSYSQLATQSREHNLRLSQGKELFEQDKPNETEHVAEGHRNTDALPRIVSKDV